MDLWSEMNCMGPRSIKGHFDSSLISIVGMSFTSILKNDSIVAERNVKYKFKIVLIGEPGVGKTSIFNRVKQGYFSNQTTLGVEFCDRYLKLVDGDVVKLSLWDTAGQERFQTITKNYYRCCNAVLFVFAVNDLSTFNCLYNWNEDVEKILGNEIPKILIGNKRDLSSVLSYGAADDFCDVRDFVYHCTTSALKGDGINDMLEWIANYLVTNKQKETYSESVNLTVTKTSKCEC